MSREGILFPTPNTMDHLGPRSAEAQEYQLRRGVEGGPYRNTTGNLREDVARLILRAAPYRGGIQVPMTKEKKAKAARASQPVGLSWDAENLRWVRPGEPDLLGGEGEAVAWPTGKERWPTSASLVLVGGEWVLVDRG